MFIWFLERWDLKQFLNENKKKFFFFFEFLFFFKKKRLFVLLQIEVEMKYDQGVIEEGQVIVGVGYWLDDVRVSELLQFVQFEESSSLSFRSYQFH